MTQYGGKQTLYDILDVPRDAKRHEIVRAYQRYRARAMEETTPPDSRLATLMHEAYEVLSDEQKREAYDRSLREERVLGVQVAKTQRGRWIAATAFVALLAALAWFFTHEKAPPPPFVGKSSQEILNAAIPAVGRVQRIDLDGKVVPLAIAVAIDEGVMMAPCQGLVPGAQLVVKLGSRAAPARVVKADGESGLCALDVERAASWPLKFAHVEPRAGEKVHVIGLNAAHEVVVSEGEVKRFDRDGKRRVIETTLPVPSGAEGAPLLDSNGGVVAIARVGSGGLARYATLPRAWIETTFRVAPPPAPPPRDETPAEDSGKGTERTVPPPEVRAPNDISPERKKRLEKAFRPPPSVPDDL